MSAVLSAPAQLDARSPVAPVISIAPVLTATARLEASRFRLRAALMEIAHPAPRPSPFDGLAGAKNFLFDRMRSWPGAALVIETLEGWWAQHPFHAVSQVAEEATRTFILPAARKNPLAVVAASVVIGALLIVSKPWKWLLRPALLVGILPQLAAQALKRMPVDTWMQMLASLLPATRKADTPRASQNVPHRASDLPGAI